MMDEVTKDLLEALLIVARMAEDLKKPCGMDPESPQAIRNAQYMNISYAARAAIARAEAAPKAVRLTHPDIAKALASAGLKPEDCREDGEILPLVLAIESAALRKNGIEVAE